MPVLKLEPEGSHQFEVEFIDGGYLVRLANEAESAELVLNHTNMLRVVSCMLKELEKHRVREVTPMTIASDKAKMFIQRENYETPST